MSAVPSFDFGVRVYYEDTDASGVVYHARYLHFFERARTEWLRALGMGQDKLMRELDVAFTVANLSIDFRVPARLDDQLDVRTTIPVLRRASLIFEQQLYRRGQTQLLARASVRVGCVDTRAFQPVPLPDALQAAIDHWRSGAEKF